MTEIGSPEKVHVELDWYDGPRSGVADINGEPHRFKSLFDEKDDEYLSTFIVYPIDEVSLALEVEQWHIFVEWNLKYESGESAIESHPGNGGINPRWDEINLILENSRSNHPKDSRKAKANFKRIERENRYDYEGPDYELCWRII